MAMQRKPLICLLSVLIIFSGCFGINAAESTNKNSPTVKLKGRPFSGTIKTVDYKEGYIVLQGKSAQTFHVNSETKIKIDGTPSNLKEIAAGAYVGGYAREVSSGRWFATTLNINTSKTKKN